MSVIVDGKLSIQYRNGRNGKFPVGVLTCELGTFSVKTRELEQYSEGSYEGKFVIARIEMASYAYGGSVNTYLLAKLDDFTINNYQTGKVVEPEPIIPDPADEEESPATEPTQTNSPVETNSAPEHQDDDFIIFGEELFEAVRRNLSVIKLDPTIGRVGLRQQTSRLKVLGYRFDAKNQVWKK